MTLREEGRRIELCKTLLGSEGRNQTKKRFTWRRFIAFSMETKIKADFSDIEWRVTGLQTTGFLGKSPIFHSQLAQNFTVEFQWNWFGNNCCWTNKLEYIAKFSTTKLRDFRTRTFILCSILRIATRCTRSTLKPISFGNCCCRTRIMDFFLSLSILMQSFLMKSLPFRSISWIPVPVSGKQLYSCGFDSWIKAFLQTWKGNSIWNSCKMVKGRRFATVYTTRCKYLRLGMQNFLDVAQSKFWMYKIHILRPVFRA